MSPLKSPGTMFLLKSPGIMLPLKSLGTLLSWYSVGFRDTWIGPMVPKEAPSLEGLYAIYTNCWCNLIPCQLDGNTVWTIHFYFLLHVMKWVSVPPNLADRMFGKTRKSLSLRVRDNYRLFHLLHLTSPNSCFTFPSYLNVHDLEKTWRFCHRLTWYE